MCELFDKLISLQENSDTKSKETRKRFDIAEHTYGTI